MVGAYFGKFTTKHIGDINLGEFKCSKYFGCGQSYGHLPNLPMFSLLQSFPLCSVCIVHSN